MAELRDFLSFPTASSKSSTWRPSSSARTACRWTSCKKSASSISPTRSASRPSRCCSATSRAGCTCSTTTRSSCSSSHDNLTFDGSSIRGFTAQRESDLRLFVDWSAFYWAPADVFGPGKVLVFGDVIDKDGIAVRRPTCAACSRNSPTTSFDKDGYTLNAANEIEGFVFKGLDAERRYHETGEFEYVNTGGYYHSLPGDPLRNVHRHGGRSAARDGLREREGPSRGRAVAVRDQLQLRRGRRRRRPDPALQADLPPGRDEARA